MRHYLSILQTTMRENWEKPVLSDYRGETFTFADMASQMARLHRIFDAAGVEAGDRVALAAKNSARWAMAFLSIATYRGVAVSILADFNPIDVAGLVNHSESKVLFIDPKIWESMNTIAMPELKAVINVEDYSPIFCVEEISAAMKRASVQAESFSAAMKEAVTNYQIGELDDLSIINYTSGTTSSPKGVMLSARNISS
ncbi:MAG: AMP-binding protein, partial [Alistipes sp.]|nr:AMP-binding protein [Alistipes sp.]